MKLPSDESQWSLLTVKVNIGSGNGLVPHINQCLPSFLYPYGITRPQRVNVTWSIFFKMLTVGHVTLVAIAGINTLLPCHVAWSLQIYRCLIFIRMKFHPGLNKMDTILQTIFQLHFFFKENCCILIHILLKLAFMISLISQCWLR